ncbi:hypothetical protein BKA82DRAFT_4147898 [Pisolithus tinctorius]|nr:hypothetical protein BKA82DRAFT_4147898 [Pisolithus tinctorius]
MVPCPERPMIDWPGRRDNSRTLLGTTPLLSSSLGLSSAQDAPIFLRIRVAEIADACYISTTVPVSAGVYMKRKLASPKEYALIPNDFNVLIYLDRTVASLEGKRELTLNH